MTELKLPEHEIDIISAMITVAEKHSLTVEVVWSFAQECSARKPVTVDNYAECAFHAMAEWIK